MRYLGILLIVSLFGMTLGDEIVKKDGSVLKGKIIEQAPGKYYKIELKDGSIFVVKEEDIEIVKYGKIEKKPLSPGKETEKELLLSRKSYKEPCLSCCLSFLIPGLGQFYNEEYEKGLLFLAADVACVSLQLIDLEEGGALFWTGAIGSTLITVLSMIDAYTIAQRINRAPGYGAILNFEKGHLTLGMLGVKANDNRKGDYQLRVVNMQF